MTETHKYKARRAFKLSILLVTILVANAHELSHAQKHDALEPSPDDDPRMISACKTVSADADYFVPENIKEHTVPSPSGAYGYREGCPFWVVDFSLNRLANSTLTPNGSRVFDESIFYGVPHDLPSSEAAGGEDPIVKEDCARLRVEHYIFKKFKHESQLSSQNTFTGRDNGTAASTDVD